MWESVYEEIKGKIRLIYKEYDKKANSMNESKNKSLKTGNQIDKFETAFLQSLKGLQKNMSDLVEEMRKLQKGSENQFRENLAAVANCLKDIRKLQQRPLNFKINPQIREIITETEKSLENIRKGLVTVKETKFLCCGADGIKKFKTPMSGFKVVAGKWKMLALFESKEGVQTFISPKFSEADFQGVSDTLRKMWPQPKVVERIVTVEKSVPVDMSGKPNPLFQANEFIYGINREQNIIEGLEIYHKQAERNNAQACCFLGKVYEQGVLVPLDMKKALTYYQKAISEKDVYANYRFAVCLMKGKVSGGQSREEIEKGFNILKRIENESAQALAELGEIYELGSFKSDVEKLFVVKKDISKAVSYYTKARNMKLARASNNLGVLYTNLKLEKLQEKDEKSQLNTELDGKIVAYLTEAEEQGFTQAYYNLGMVYSKGIAGQKNSDLALQMFYEGSLKGDYKCKIKFAYELMNQTSILKEEYEEHYHLAIHWLESVVRRLSINHATVSQPPEILKGEKGEALFYLGIFHEHGFGVEKSPKKAITYFIESSDLDYPAAKNKIGDCYFSGFGLKQDRQCAVGCYLAAAEMGNSDAMVNLGSVYLNGLPGLVQKSYKKAFEYFSKAQSLDNSDAMIHLSYMYKNGWGVPVSEQSAQQLLQQAAILRNATALYMLKEQGLDFNEGVLFQHLQNEFFSVPKKINLKEVVPTLKSAVKSKLAM